MIALRKRNHNVLHERLEPDGRVGRQQAARQLRQLQWEKKKWKRQRWVDLGLDTRVFFYFPFLAFLSFFLTFLFSECTFLKHSFILLPFLFFLLLPNASYFHLSPSQSTHQLTRHGPDTSNYIACQGNCQRTHVRIHILDRVERGHMAQLVCEQASEAPIGHVARLDVQPKGKKN